MQPWVRWSRDGNRQEENTPQVTAPEGVFKADSASPQKVTWAFAAYSEYFSGTPSPKRNRAPKPLASRREYLEEDDVARKTFRFFGSVSVGAVKKLRLSLLGDSLAACLWVAQDAEKRWILATVVLEQTIVMQTAFRHISSC